MILLCKSDIEKCMKSAWRTNHGRCIFLGAKSVYIISQLVYCVGMIIMAIVRNPVTVILLSPTAGIMYATLFTMPYMIVANYHTKGQVRDTMIRCHYL